MAQEPKKKHSKARKRTRRAAIKLSLPNMVKCSHCDQMTISHQVCKNCGYYGQEKVTSKLTVKVVKS